MHSKTCVYMYKKRKTNKGSKLDFGMSPAATQTIGESVYIASSKVMRLVKPQAFPSGIGRCGLAQLLTIRYVLKQQAHIHCHSQPSRGRPQSQIFRERPRFLAQRSKLINLVYIYIQYQYIIQIYRISIYPIDILNIDISYRYIEYKYIISIYHIEISNINISYPYIIWIYRISIYRISICRISMKFNENR